MAQIDSAKKLRWYDREDLSQLVEVTTKEKLQLQETITALRQVPATIHQQFYAARLHNLTI